MKMGTDITKRVEQETQASVPPQTKTALGELRSPFKELQQQSGQKKLENICTKKGKKTARTIC